MFYEKIVCVCNYSHAYNLIRMLINVSEVNVSSSNTRLPSLTLISLCNNVNIRKVLYSNRTRLWFPR